MYWKIALITISLFCSMFLSYNYGHRKANEVFLEYKLTKSKEEILFRDKLIAEKEHLANLVIENRKAKENEIKAINRRHASIVSSLQQRASRPEAPSNPTTETVTAVCTGTGSSGDRLYREDAEFLIGEATRAETLKQALLECRRNKDEH
jgi:hypothetical protein